jgi:hypothetical protein
MSAPPVKAGGRAFRGRGSRQRCNLAALTRKLLHCERDRGIGEIGNRGDALAVEPTARDRRGDISLVLMISVDHLDWAAEHIAAEVLDRHARREHRGRAAKVAIEAALVVTPMRIGSCCVRPREGGRTVAVATVPSRVKRETVTTCPPLLCVFGDAS